MGYISSSPNYSGCHSFLDMFGGSFMDSQCISMFMDDVGARLKTPQFWQFLWRENDLCNHNESVDLVCCFQLIFQTKPYGENMVIIMVFIWGNHPQMALFQVNMAH